MSLSAEHPQLPLSLSLRESARFESFYTGSNAEIVTILESITAGNSDSLVFIKGKSGTGKSHLLQAVCHAGGSRGLSAAYLPLKELQELSPEMLEGLGQIDLICVDDIDSIAGQCDWEAAVFNLFNQAQAAGSDMVFTGTAKPAECGLELPDLVSRLGWGLTYTLKTMDDAQLQAALEMRAIRRGLELPDDTAQFLLRRISRDLHSVFGLFDRLDEASMIEKRRLTIPFVKSVLDLMM